MTTDRLEQLIKFHEEDPGDPFTLYGLALEYQKTDRLKSDRCFDTLLNKFPDYLPTYYHAAKLKSEFGHTDAAADIYKRGMELAQKLRDDSTLRELKSAYDEMMF